MLTATLAINEIQLFTLKTALELEIKTYSTSKMQFTREPALRIFKRLVGDPLHLPAFRGLKGRYEALEIVESFLKQIEDGTAKPVEN